MKTPLRIQLLAAAASVVALAPAPASACAACFGRSDSPMAYGLNAGILALLLVVFFVLAAIAAFFVFIARRAARLSAATGSQPNIATDGPPQPAGISQPTPS